MTAQHHQSLLKLLCRLWPHISPRRRVQLGALFVLMVLASLAVIEPLIPFVVLVSFGTIYVPILLATKKRLVENSIPCSAQLTNGVLELPYPDLTSQSNFKMSTEESHLQVLRLLQTNPRVNQRGLADALGISLGKTNYCLKALMSKGLIKVQNFRSSDNKLAYAYLLTPAGIAEKANLTARFLKRKISEYEALNHEIQQLRQELESVEGVDRDAAEPGAAMGARS